LGLLFAAHLVEQHGVRHLMLVSRSGSSSPAVANLIESVWPFGVEVELVACDTSNREALATVIASIPENRPLSAVVHAAGVLDDALVSRMTADQLSAVMRPKIDAAWNLHELTVDVPLDAFVLFSSISGLWGGPGQANYAAGNAFLDALACERRRLSLVGTSILWGLWTELGGMTSHLGDSDRARMRSAGFGLVDKAYGLQRFDAALARNEAICIATPIEPNGASAMLLADWMGRSTRQTKSGALLTGSLASQLDGLLDRERLDTVADFVSEHVASVVGLGSAEAVQRSMTFREIGFDSLMAVDLRNRLAEAAGIRLAASVAFDHPTPEALADHIVSSLSDAPKHVAASRTEQSDEPIAIVAMSCRYPGGVEALVRVKLMPWTHNNDYC